MKNTKKIVLVGTGFVGMSFAYALLNQQAADELVLIDIDHVRAMGEAMDMSHGLAFAGGHMDIYAGTYSDCKNADIVCICAGVNQRPGETRIALLERNGRIFCEILKQVLRSGFDGIFLVASNPVDSMAQLTQQYTGFPASRVIGTGTTLDTARLRYLLGEYFAVDPRNIHAYVMGEHGDSEFVPWSQAMLSTMPIEELITRAGGQFERQALDRIQEEVRTAAQKIIAAKKATYYGIGMAMVRITRAILGDEHCVLTVSARLNGEYGQHGVFAGVPAIVGRGGIERVLPLPLSDAEQEKMAASCRILNDSYKGLQL